MLRLRRLGGAVAPGYFKPCVQAGKPFTHGVWESFMMKLHSCCLDLVSHVLRILLTSVRVGTAAGTPNVQVIGW